MNSHSAKIAPLASQESLDRMPPRFAIAEPWAENGWEMLSRTEQNQQIFRTLDRTVRHMRDGVRAGQARVEDMRRRIERLETLMDLSEAGQISAQPNTEVSLSLRLPTGEAPGETVQDWHYASGSENDDEDETPSDPPDYNTIQQHKQMNPKITLNVGGQRHEIMWRQLEKKPLTRLGRLARAKTHEDLLELADGYSLAENEIYFDRDPATFNCILNFYRTNRLHVLDEICILDYQEDLEFWMIKELSLEICCIDKFTARRDAIVEEIDKQRAFSDDTEEVEDFGKGYFVKYQKCLWDLMEKPQSSLPAKVLSLISILLVLVSLVGMCLNTFPWLQAKDINGKPVDNPKLALIELICIAYFTVEFLLRLAGAPKKLAFLKNTMNIVDCAAILPYYITLFLMPQDDFGTIPSDTTTTASTLGRILEQQRLDTTTMSSSMSSSGGEEETEGGGFDNFSRIMQVFRIARIMRIFKLARRSVGLQAMAHTVRTSWKDLGLLFMLVGMGMLVFGSLLYYIENNEPETSYVSIPDGMWWAVQTLTSLGYGDYWPETVIGKIVGSSCAVCGVLVMALPIPIVVDNFANYYSEQKKLEAQELKREANEKDMMFRADMREAALEGLVETIAKNVGENDSNEKNDNNEKGIIGFK